MHIRHNIQKSHRAENEWGFTLDLLQFIQHTPPPESHAENLNWISGLTSLKYLNLGFVKLDSAGTDWLQALNKLSALVELRLHWCKLQVPLSLPFINFTSLSVLDLSENSFNSEIPEWLFNLTSLSKLYLRWNFFNGPIPGEFANLKLLEFLICLTIWTLEAKFQVSLETFQAEEFRSFCKQLNGEIQEFLGGSLSSLKTLDLSYNRMNSTIPKVSANSLSVSCRPDENSWTGILSEAHMMKLGRLEYVTITTEPPDPGKAATPFGISKFKGLDLGSNHFEGPFPPNAKAAKTDLSWNRLDGKVPSSMCELEGLQVLSLRSNKLDIPRCIGNLSGLVFGNNTEVFERLIYVVMKGRDPEYRSIIVSVNTIDLSWNNVTGRIPEEIARLSALRMLNLSHNYLSGPS
ncbi:leucine-rich repeat receptor-like protein kinase PEPR2 [Pistacia vera]|uniref:leucine-rich repeat receptor-like protein kinase PEPR2 n=1 Tax=Pistacia vera TaxID=55513 RepID=UPI00126314EA|nr:leucine-rich repeat receptor-like protein kinase PEPR2 [Pistacia vera]